MAESLCLRLNFAVIGGRLLLEMPFNDYGSYRNHAVNGSVCGHSNHDRRESGDVTKTSDFNTGDTL